MVTAVFATRAMLGLLAGFSGSTARAFMGATGAQIPTWIRDDYVGKRRLWFAISGAIVVDLRSGRWRSRASTSASTSGAARRSTFQTPQPVALEDVRDAGGARSARGARSIQGVGAEIGDEQYREFQMRTRVADRRRAATR